MRDTRARTPGSRASPSVAHAARRKSRVRRAAASDDEARSGEDGHSAREGARQAGRILEEQLVDSEVPARNVLEEIEQSQQARHRRPRRGGAHGRSSGAARPDHRAPFRREERRPPCWAPSPPGRAASASGTGCRRPSPRGPRGRRRRRMPRRRGPRNGWTPREGRGAATPRGTAGRKCVASLLPPRESESHAQLQNTLYGASLDSPASRTSRTLCARVRGVKGFWRKAVPASRTPCRMIASSV